LEYSFTPNHPFHWTKKKPNLLERFRPKLGQVLIISLSLLEEFYWHMGFGEKTDYSGAKFPQGTFRKIEDSRSIKLSVQFGERQLWEFNS